MSQLIHNGRGLVSVSRRVFVQTISARNGRDRRGFSHNCVVYLIRTLLGAHGPTTPGDLLINRRRYSMRRCRGY